MSQYLFFVILYLYTIYRLLAAEAHHHVCVFSLRYYFGDENNPGAQIPFNYHLLIQVRKDDLVNSVDRAIKFWFEVTSANNTPNWVVRILIFIDLNKNRIRNRQLKDLD